MFASSAIVAQRTPTEPSCRDPFPRGYQPRYRNLRWKDHQQVYMIRFYAEHHQFAPKVAGREPLISTMRSKVGNFLIRPSPQTPLNCLATAKLARKASAELRHSSHGDRSVDSRLDKCIGDATQPRGRAVQGHSLGFHTVQHHSGN